MILCAPQSQAARRNLVGSQLLMPGRKLKIENASSIETPFLCFVDRQRLDWDADDGALAGNDAAVYSPYGRLACRYMFVRISQFRRQPWSG